MNASPDNIDITTLLGSVRRGLPRLAMVTAAVGIATYLVLSMVAPRYSSEAQLVVVARGSPESVGVRMDREAVNTHVRALSSPDLATRIAGQLKLAELKEFNNALGSLDLVDALLRMAGLGGPRPGESEQDRVLSAYFRQLDVYAAKESRFIGVRFTSVDPELAATAANAIAESYREALAKQSIVETDTVQQALEPKIARLVEEVTAADAEVERFRGAANIFTGGPQRTGLDAQQLAELTAELSRIQATRGEAEARARQARDMLRSGSADVVGDVQRSPLVRSLVEQRVRVERQIHELSATLLPAHPRMRQLDADLKGLKRQIEAEVGRVVESLEKEAKVAAAREEAVKRSLEQVKSRVVDTSGEEAKLRQLEAAAQSKRTELERLRAQYEANRGRADSRVVPVEARLVTRARASSVPAYPRKGPYAALLAAATFLIGLALIVTRALLAGARPVGMPATAVVAERAGATARREPVPARDPVFEPSSTSPPAGASARPASRPAGAAPTSEPQPLAVVRTPAGLAELIGGQPSPQSGWRTLLVGLHGSPDLHATAVAVTEALSASGAEAILIDWSRTSDGSGRPGMSELIAGSASFEQAIGRLPGSSVHFMAGGASLPAQADALDVDRLNLVLDALDEAYDHIVVAARQDLAQVVFEALEGRFDAGVVIGSGSAAERIGTGPGSFLGFEVEGLLVAVLEPASVAGSLPRGRFALAAGRSSATA